MVSPSWYLSRCLSRGDYRRRRGRSHYRRRRPREACRAVFPQRPCRLLAFTVRNVATLQIAALSESPNILGHAIRSVLRCGNMPDVSDDEAVAAGSGDAARVLFLLRVRGGGFLVRVLLRYGRRSLALHRLLLTYIANWTSHFPAYLRKPLFMRSLVYPPFWDAHPGETAAQISLQQEGPVVDAFSIPSVKFIFLTHSPLLFRGTITSHSTRRRPASSSPRTSDGRCRQPYEGRKT